ncbi:MULTISPECIES: RsmB/NOP family class I SAM-dependent RNA methyltransferase [Rhizobium/Agrobacterium group]|uniref:RsmB/NOP family class I SAM-dependent RNA methyltransferase n=1 Tax=Rhizobium/Agrobacterium group TaxID=227290 RepID=UPI00083DEC15|nr:transcription antitermination factor NusB [Agrobacterium sp. RAC06]AOG08840.1 nusB family protein [Agrobacterium sp. RAC06]MDM7982211.1 transcription antitermination factor NusB [Rhizobium sp.]MDM8015413.1 transcription antitermination factor NusB [Rhizobium sp.]
MVLNDTSTGKPKSKHNGNRKHGDHASRQPLKPGLEARIAASRILAAVIDRKTSLDGMLDSEHGNPAFLPLNDADRGLVKAILQSALRHLPRIEAIIAELLDTPLPDGARSLHHLLIVAAAQMLYLDVPDHSAVDLAVEQANGDPRSRRFSKLVNAILRRIGREKAELLAAVDDLPCMPDWFMARLTAVYGDQRALAIAASQLESPTIDLTVKSDAAGWAARLGGQVLPTGSVRLERFRGSVTALEGFEDGEWWVQDAAAAIPAKLFGDLTGKRVADLCAAPGGKTAQLVLAGGDVLAVEQSKSRLKRLESNLQRLGVSVEIRCANLLDLDENETFDAILLDTPCSSTGTTRRHPDVLWTKNAADIAKLAELQEKLLRHAVTLLKPGGCLVFSNCSIDPSEGEEIVARVLAEIPDLRLQPIDPADWPGLEAAITAKGEFRTTPDMLRENGGLDGFYAAVIAKT